jgi:hypothetical protein
MKIKIDNTAGWIAIAFVIAILIGAFVSIIIPVLGLLFWILWSYIKHIF